MVAVLQWVNAVAFAVLGLLGYRQWRRHPTTPAAWMTAAFGLLGASTLLGRILPDDLSGVPQLASLTFSAVGLLAFPYLLFRFAAAFGGVRPAVRHAATALAALVLVITLAGLPAIADAEPSWLPLLLLLIIAYWTVLSVWVVGRLWRAGREQPTAARRRMRALALSAGVLNLALIISLGTSDSTAFTVLSQLLGTASAAGFFVAFSPPGVVRREWRRDDEQALAAAHEDLLRADTRVDAANSLLPRVANLFGTMSAAFLDDEGRPVAALKMSADELRAVKSTLADDAARGMVVQRGDWFALRLEAGWLIIGANRYAPFFGAEERTLLESITGFLDLALERVELLNAERESRERVEAASKEIETLLYGISHDLRNPLVSILGYVDLLEEDYRDRLDEEGRHYLARLEANARYMDALIGDLLELSRVGRTQHATEPVALSPLLEDIASELGSGHPEATIELTPMPVVEMNPARARQLFTNLIGNALSHGGRADLTVRVTASRDEDGSVTISVRDDGRGIPASYREQVFRIFERLEGPGNGQGTGIGLAMCQRIVEQLGGRIWIAPADAGTDVRVQLPGDTLRDEPSMEVHA